MMAIELEERVVALERELEDVRERLARVEPAAHAVRRPVNQLRVEHEASRQPEIGAGAGSGTAQHLTPSVPTPRAEPAWWKPAFNVEELLGGRLLALAGGIAVLVGAIFFVGLAIDRGWMDETTRVVLALTASSLLLGVGAWLYERKGRTQAALCAAGAALASLYLSLAAGTALYHLIPAPAALCAAFAVGALGTLLALRWNAGTIAGLGIIGCLLAPLFAGGLDGPGALFLLIAYGAAAAICAWRRWEWLASASFVAAAGQVAVWSIDAPPTLQRLSVLAALGGLTLAATIGYQVRVARAGVDASSAFVLATSGLLVGALGLYALPHATGELSGGLWVGGVAAVHAVLGAGLLAWRRVDRTVACALLGLALVAADVTVGLLAGGVALSVGWALSAFVLGWAVQRAGRHGDLLRIGLGGQLSVAIAHTLLFDAPPGSVTEAGVAAGSAIAAVAAVIVTAFGCARLACEDRRALRSALDALAAVALAYVAALALDGVALTLAWAGIAAAVGQLRRYDDTGVAKGAALGFLGLATIHALAFEARPDTLLYGATQLGPALAALAGIAAAALALARGSLDLERASLLAAAGTGVLALASVAIVSVLTPAGGGVAQDAQVALSALWGLSGLGLLSAGLRRRGRPLRLAGLGLLVVALGKVFVFDLQALDSIWRVLSCVGLGLLLLLAALAYQRMRPERDASSA
jgi:hypothetical protein